MFDIPESDIVGVRVDEEAIKTNKSPEYIRSRQVSSTDDHGESSTETDDLKTKQNTDSKISLPTRWERERTLSKWRCQYLHPFLFPPVEFSSLFIYI